MDPPYNPDTLRIMLKEIGYRENNDLQSNSYQPLVLHKTYRFMDYYGIRPIVIVIDTRPVDSVIMYAYDDTNKKYMSASDDHYPDALSQIPAMKRIINYLKERRVTITYDN